MRRTDRATILLLALTAAAVAQEIDGRVLEDTSGEPLASAELRFHKAGVRELAADLETERDGKFHASSLPAGEYTVDVSKPNHVAATLKLRVPASGMLVRLVRYAVIAGMVRDTEGRPVPGRVLLTGGRTGGSARVAVLVKQDGSDEMKVVRTVPLDEGGRYRIFDLPPGQYALGLWWAGLSAGSGAQMYPNNSHPRFFDVAGGEEYRDVDFLVISSASFSVSGKIDGLKPGTHFSVALGLPDLPALPVGQLWTEDDGSFRLDKIPPGTYDLLVAGPTGGYGPFDSLLRPNPLYGRTRIQVIGQNLEGVSVPVSAGPTLDVVLRGPPEGCPKSATVMLTLLEPWALMSNSTVQANFDKPQTARDLAPARYSLTASGLGTSCYQVSRAVADLSREVSGPVALMLGQAGSIRGRLRAGTAETKGFTVVLLDADSADGTPAQLAFPDEQGRFEFAGLRPGRYRIAAQATGAAKARWVADVAHMIVLDVPGGVPTELELPVSMGAAQ
jgi:Carboxypeptidase regulatory-like domain